MQTNEFGVIQAFLEKMDPKDEKVQEGLGTSERQMELFWAALIAVSEDTGLVVPNFNKLAAKLIKFPSTYITELKKRGLIERGSKRGEWSITSKVIKKMNALLSGETAPAETPAAATTRRARRVKPAKLQRILAKTTVGQLVKSLEERLADIHAQMSELAEERAILEGKLKVILEVLK